MSSKQDDKELLSYYPERELPDEIKNLPKDEVVCKFCGVSYLIHHEIKELQMKLKYLEACSAQLEECKKREKKLQQEAEVQKLNLDSQAAEIERCHSENVKLNDNLTKANACIQEKYLLLEEKDRCLGKLKNSVTEKLDIHQAVLAALKTDISTSCDTVRVLSKNYNDVISSVTTRLKVDLSKNESSLKDKIVQLAVQCDLVSQAKACVDAENERLVSVVQNVQSQKQECEERNKIATSELKREINELNMLLTQSRSVVAAGRVAKQDMEGKLRSSHCEATRLNNLLSDKTSEHAEETKRLQSEHDGLKVKLHLTEEELRRVQVEYDNALKAHHSTTATTTETIEAERKEKDRLLKERELLIETHQNRLQELQEHFRDEKLRLEAVLEEKQRTSTNQLTQLQLNMETRLAMELSKANKETEKEYKNLLKAKATAIQQLQDQLESTSEQRSADVAQLNERLRLKQLENDAELTAHIHQVKDLELRLKQSTEDASRRSEEEALAAAAQVDTLSKQVTSLQEQLQVQENHCAKLNKDLQRSHDEVEHLHNTVHLECKERIELTAALEQAREQLLVYKMKDKTLTPPVSAGPVPPQQSYHGNTLSSLNHSRQRIAQVTGRLSKSDSRHTKSGRF